MKQSDLTTGEARFIREAEQQDLTFIEQPYHLYSNTNQQTWQRLFRANAGYWERYANARFLKGIDLLKLDDRQIPRLEEINVVLKQLTGFCATPVRGYIPAYTFFDCLRQRQFPTTVTIRSSKSLDYVSEPDIWHDVAGHVPMHADPAFAATLVRFGECAQLAAEIVHGIKERERQLQTLTSIIRAMARFFWFTIEFGLIGSRQNLKACGSGLLSSFGEMEHAFSDQVQRQPFQIEWAINMPFPYNQKQALYFYIADFDQLFAMVDRLEVMMKEGALNCVVPGEPGIDPADLQSFLKQGQ